MNYYHQLKKPLWEVLVLTFLMLTLFLSSCKDDDNNEITHRTVSTFAGTGINGHINGNAATARFNEPFSVAVDKDNNIYVADTENHRIRKITPTGTVTTIAGNGDADIVDGPADEASFYYPIGIAVDLQGNIYVIDSQSNFIRKISTQGIVSSLAEVPGPYGLDVDKDGNIYVTCPYDNRVYKINSSGIVSIFAGNGTGYANGPRADAKFDLPIDVTIDAEGNIYIADFNNQRIRKIASDGNVTTLAGSTVGYTDGIGSAAQFNLPIGITADKAGNVYVADKLNDRIRKITPSGIVTTIAGGGTSPHAIEDMPAQEATFVTFEGGIAVDSQNNIYIADPYNHVIRKIGL